MNSYPTQSHSYDYPQQPAINPALLAAFQSQNNQPGGSKFTYATGGVIPLGVPTGSINPAQLMNGMGITGGIGLNGHSMNPAQVLQQQHQQHQPQQQHLADIAMGGTGLGMGMGIGMNEMTGMGINPAALSGASSVVGGGIMSPNLGMSNPSLSTALNGAAGMGMGINMGMGLSMNVAANANASPTSTNPASNPISHHPSLSQTQPHLITRQQFAQMSPQERQKYIFATQHQQQQQLAHGMTQMPQQPDMLAGMLRTGVNLTGGVPNANTGFHDRDHPSSSASSSLQNNLVSASSTNPSQNPNSLHNQSHPQITHPQHQNQLMPPPPARPSTAQSQRSQSQQHSRPGTSHSHHSPRPPSRTASEYAHLSGATGGAMNGYSAKQQQNIYPGHGQGQVGQGTYPQNAFPPLTPQQLQQSSLPSFSPQNLQQSSYPGLAQAQQPSLFPSGQVQQNVYNPQHNAFSSFPGGGGTQGQGSGLGQQISPPSPTSPHRGSKRKVGGMESPRLGGMGIGAVTGMSGVGMAGAGGGMMGPPVLPRQLSEQHFGNAQVQINGFSQQQQQPPQTQTPQQQLSGGNVGISGSVSAPSNMPMPMPMVNNDATRMNALTAGVAMDGSQTPQIRQVPIGPQTPMVYAQLQPSQQQPQSLQQTAKQASMQPGLTRNGGVVVKGPEIGLGMRTKTPTVMSSAAPSSVTGLSATSSGSVVPPPATLRIAPGVTVNSAVTRVTNVPLSDSLKLIPELSEAEIKDVQHWMRLDREYEIVWRRMKERMAEEVREVKGIARMAWWERDPVEGNVNTVRKRGREPFDVRYPRSRKERDGREKRRSGRREGLKLPRKLKAEDVDRPEQLVPIRLEFDVEHHKMRDTFVWNLNDPVVTPENFAQSLVDDYSLPSSYHAVITKSIQDQLSDFKAHSANYDGDTSDVATENVLEEGLLDEEDVAWWNLWRKRLRKPSGHVRTGKKAMGKGRKKRKLDKEALSDIAAETETSVDRPLGANEIEVDEKLMHEEMRILIKLDIIVGSMKLDDQFEWDIEDVNASPEQFAEVYVKELGLGGEFKTAIAHCIREQIQTYQKSLFLVGHPSDGSPIQDDDLRTSFLPTLTSGARPIDQVPSFTPLLNHLSDGELEKNEKERDKDLNKRRKRNMRSRRGLALPDREPIRTYRTPGIGFPALDAATLALTAAASAPTSRRAAAAAAQLTIANMVASENGTAVMPQMMPMVAVPPPASSGEKKPKGLFKAPSYPSSILRPRARVTAPTPSTAADTSLFPPAPVVETEPPPSTVAVASAPPDAKVAKALSAKRVKELEREAKEKEYADGQHANFIDGVWHCSNCGCPESIAIGRRKGPLGDKSQCGPCGKFWHRHRRPLPVEYTTDPEFHMNKRETELVKTVVKKRGGAAALRGQGSTNLTPGDASTECHTPRGRGDGWMDVSARSSPPPMAPDDRAISPISTASSSSEPPLAQKFQKVNGSNNDYSTPAPPPTGSTNANAGSTRNSVRPSDISSLSSSPARPVSSEAPEWLSLALQAMQEKYTDDRFEVILRKANPAGPSEWRIKCLDCPGKLYTPGPAETLSNYEVHLKNRQHRQRVNSRLSGVAS